MINRIALVGLAVAGLAAPAAAASSTFDSDRAGAQPVQDFAPGTLAAEPEPETDGDTPSIGRARGRSVRPRVVHVLPPLRPAFDRDAVSADVPVPTEIAVAVPDVPAPFAGQAASADVPAGSDPGPDVTPAGRPGGRVVSVLPPLRPAFATDDPAEPAASADAASPAPVDAAVVRVVGLLPPPRPAFRSDAALAEVAPAEPAPVPEPPRSLFGSLFNAPLAAAGAIGPAVVGAGQSVMGAGRSALNSLIAAHAQANDVPADLVHRVVIRESKYNPRAVGYGGALGLMQIKHATARALGYTGPASGLLDADTNLTYAVKYLAGAYRTANGNYDQAVRYYARGYYYAAKAHSVRYASGRRSRAERREADASAAVDAETTSR